MVYTFFSDNVFFNQVIPYSLYLETVPGMSIPEMYLLIVELPWRTATKYSRQECFFRLWFYYNLFLEEPTTFTWLWICLMCFYGDRYISTSMKVSLERSCFSGIRVHPATILQLSCNYPATIMIRERGMIKRSNFFRFFFLTNDPPFQERREDLHIYKKTVKLQNIDSLLSL